MDNQEVTGASASADQALVCDQARAGLDPTGFDPSRCQNCAGCDWVCENHHDRPWGGLSEDFLACECGAGSPCPVCQPEMANAPLIYSIAQEARRYAAFYQPGSDARHTFEMFAEFVETRAIAQAIEARRAATGTGAVEDESAVLKGRAHD